ncbi:MAG: glycoside hydrolase family 65 protein, partial [Hymenobacteraceae bacterium]|nr:glycoside hydrolase family 65 protein [Hymenobacteraceae bacterium]MDX5397763.1 glycoside hydrolase family 65 protein [Hymenobacteraceae bacterium]MDX5513840.1 glycoside hydrolase family 65 protein [Hymenobacteraceae bacterium]
MDNWKIIFEKWVPEEQPLREALCTLGNGYFATRGAMAECGAGGVHYPGTYLAGGYNRLKSEVSGQIMENEDLVNWPNWLSLTFRHEGETEWFTIEKVEVIHYRLVLNMEEGVLIRHLRFRDKQKRETSLTTRRFVSMAQKHLAALQLELTPENWSGKIEVCSAIDGGVTNSGVPRYRKLAGQHLQVLQTGENEEQDTVFMEVETVQSKVRVAQAVRTSVLTEIPSCELKRELKQKENYVAHVLTVACEQQRPVHVEKVLALFASRDKAITEPVLEAQKAVARVSSFAEILNEHRRVWRQLWERSDLKVACNDRTHQILRLHIFHLLQTASMHTGEADAGVPARGWHGEAYRGHIFWDELFIFPFLNLRLPELTRQLLMYRYRRLTEARFAAREAGYRGAMFPWQSGSNGREESQIIHLNPKSGRWLPDNTFLQRHINAAVAYNVWHYYQATHDREFLIYYGAELIFEIAQFWSTIAIFSQEKGRYEIRNVVGPDEYHTSYPGSESPGLNNNAYTNVMAVWVIQCALQVMQLLDRSRVNELKDKCAITTDDVE